MGNATEAKNAVKALIGHSLDQAIKRLEDILDPASPAYNTFVLLKSRYKQYQNNVMLGITGQDEVNKQYTQISHAFIIAVDSLEDSDLKPPALQPPPPVLQTAPPPPTTPESAQKTPPKRPKEEKASTPVPVRASEPPMLDSSPPATLPALMTNRKYQIFGAVALVIASVAIWTVMSGKEKPAASSLTENKTDATGLKQPDSALMATSIQPQPNTAPQQKAADDPAKKSSEPARNTSEPTSTKKPSSAAASLGANDLRFDGKTYGIFRSGGRIWMAQNLDYELPGSWCYGGSDNNCLKYGRLYTLSAAKKACAAMGSGWHVPTDREWKSLTSAFGGAGEDASDGGAAAFKALTAGGARGFSAQLSGWRDANGRSKHLGSAGYYWSSTENALGLISVYLFSNGEVSQVNNNSTLGFSCRCVK